MILDARQLQGTPDLQADVCVVGAGAAGIAMARELAGSGLEVIVLEGGGEEYDLDGQLLYQGSESGPMIGPKVNYLTTTRLRYFGGSTNHWNGWCRPLDPEDFEARSWIPGSGWPIGPADLDPWYRRASEVLEIPLFDYDPAQAGRYPHLLKGDPAFETVYFHMSPPTRLGRRYREDLEKADRVRVLLHANVLRLAATADADAVSGVECATPEDRRFVVRARRFVLAAGAVENARLLLASNDVVANGLGNDHDLVGRFFMEHPMVRIGQVVIPYWRVLMSTYDDNEGRSQVRGVLRVRREFQRAESLVNGLLVFWEVRGAELDPLAGDVAWLATDLVQVARDIDDPEPGTMYLGQVQLACEQLPNRDNRVGLADSVDRFGVPRSSLHWRVTETDAEHIRKAATWLARRLGAHLRGRLQVALDGDELWPRLSWSNHHMGTTRMADSPALGVVDANCRVHGIDNLFVAGSSVFPTCGAANPTYTLVALALRLADHLRTELAS